MITLIVFSGRVADRNPKAMLGAEHMGEVISRLIGIDPEKIGLSLPPLLLEWHAELEAARQELLTLYHSVTHVLQSGKQPLVVMNRCATALGTLPAVALAYPHAAIVWFDAHGDCNTPTQSASGYLGGMVLTGAAGHWQTGFGDTLDLHNVILVGARDLDACERILIEERSIQFVAPGPGLADRLRIALAGRPAYVHLDCDVLSPGIVPTEYHVPEGLSIYDLDAACTVIAEGEVIGLEIAEFEVSWPDGTLGNPSPVLKALDSLIAAMS